MPACRVSASAAGPVPALRKRDVYEVRRERMQLLLMADHCPNQQQPCRALSAIPEPQPEELTVTVNGRAVSVPQGASLYDAAAKLGAFVPILCKHPRLPNTPGACRCVQQAHAAAAAAAPQCPRPCPAYSCLRGLAGKGCRLASATCAWQCSKPLQVASSSIASCQGGFARNLLQPLRVSSSHHPLP